MIVLNPASSASLPPRNQDITGKGKRKNLQIVLLFR